MQISKTRNITDFGVCLYESDIHVLARKSFASKLQNKLSWQTAENFILFINKSDYTINYMFGVKNDERK